MGKERGVWGEGEGCVGGRRSGGCVGEGGCGEGEGCVGGRRGVWGG